MTKKSTYLLIGVFISGQLSLGITAVNYDAKVFERKIESVKYREANEKIEVNQYPEDKSKVKVVYKVYEKKKNFTNIENNVAIMNKVPQHFSGGIDNEKSEPGKIAKAMAGKLFMGEV